MFSIACFTITARIIIRITTRRRLFLDDFFIFFGFIILSGTTYLFRYARDLFLSEALATDMIRYETFKELAGPLEAIPGLKAFFCMAWSTIFCVKLSFLALFKVLIRRLSIRLTIYYWVVVVATILTWMLLAFNSFCPHACKHICIHIHPNDYFILPC